MNAFRVSEKLDALIASAPVPDGEPRAKKSNQNDPVFRGQITSNPIVAYFLDGSAQLSHD
jgi:hypothetical protein